MLVARWPGCTVFSAFPYLLSPKILQSPSFTVHLIFTVFVWKKRSWFKKSVSCCYVHTDCTTPVKYQAGFGSGR